MFLIVRIASGLLFLTGLGTLRLSVELENYLLLVAGLVVAAVAFVWMLLGGTAATPSRRAHAWSAPR